MRFIRKESSCKTCPLRDRVKVWSEVPAPGAKLIIVGESPGVEEEAERKPFVGPAGRLLNKALFKAGIERHRCFVMNLLACRPPGNAITSPEAVEAIELCRAGRVAEMASAIADGAKAIVPLGAAVMKELGQPGSITKLRGSPFEVAGIVAIPTYHPSFLLHNWGYRNKNDNTMKGNVEVEWVADLSKAKRLAENGWHPPSEHFRLSPTIDEFERFASDCVNGKKPVAVDIETTSLRPDRGEIFVVGLAVSGEDAISFPFLEQGGGEYWSVKDKPRALNALRAILELCPTIYQNAPFDVMWLREKGFAVNDVRDDVLLAHHAIHPELSHKLADIVSVYGETPYWKDAMLARATVLRDMPNETLRTYNLRDAAVLHQILPGLLADLEELRTLHVYRDVSMKLVNPIIEMVRVGMPVDEKALKKWTRELKKEVEALSTKLRESARLPESFNLDSDDHLRLLLYGYKAAQFSKAEAELKSYDEPGCRKKKDSIKFREIAARVKVAGFTESLWTGLPPSKRSQKTGLPSLDEDALLRRRIAAEARLATIQRMTGHWRSEREDEEALLEKTIEWLVTFQRFSERSKLLTTYTKFDVVGGRLHGLYLIHGTASGRLSSRQPNMQNMPPEARGIFRTPPGFVFVSGDYSNLELRVLAYVSQDEALLKTFAEGRNVHDENTRDLFRLTPEADLWKAARKASKIYIFGRNYGGGLRGIFERVAKEVPELRLPYAQFVAADSRYRAAHPTYSRWADAVRREVVETRKLTSVFGRVRIFLGTPEAIQREGLNHVIQSPAADIMNRGMIRVYQTRKPYVRIVAQVHDELLLECPAAKAKETEKLLKTCLEAPVEILGKSVSFPVETSVGTVWKELKE